MDTNQLLSLFYCTFDNIHGPKIVYQEPDGFLPDEAYKQIASYGILPESLCNKLITITAGEYKIMSFALGFGDLKYERAKLHCNFSMVFPKDANTAPYEPVLCKLAGIMDTLERESGFLAAKGNDRMKDLLAIVYKGLTRDGECKITIDKANSICLRLLPRFPPAGIVKAHEVPVLTYDIQTLSRTGWDLTLQRVLTFIDGVRHVQLISQEAHMDLSMVEEALRHLVYYKCVTLIDIFQFSNFYEPTSLIAELASNRRMQSDCLAYIACRDADEPDVPDAELESGAAPHDQGDAAATAGDMVADRKKSKSLSIHRVFQLYCGLSRDTPVKDVCLSSKYFQRNLVDPRRFITFGLVNGFLRRIHIYPVVKPVYRDKFPRPLDPTDTAPEKAEKEAEGIAVRMMDGNHSADEIAVRRGLSWSLIRTWLERNMLPCEEIRK